MKMKLINHRILRGCILGLMFLCACGGNQGSLAQTTPAPTTQETTTREKTEQEKYDEALQDYNTGAYEEAYEQFKNIETFQDSSAYVEKCSYEIAKKLLDTGASTEVEEYLEEIQDGVMLEELMPDYQYNVGVNAYEEGEYDIAYEQLMPLEISRVYDALYLLCEAYIEQKDVTTANKIISKIKEYNPEEVQELRYQLKFALYENDPYSLVSETSQYVAWDVAMAQQMGGDSCWLYGAYPYWNDATGAQEMYYTAHDGLEGYKIWYNHVNDEEITITETEIDGRTYCLCAKYYVDSTEYTIMCYADAPEEKFCVEYCVANNGIVYMETKDSFANVEELTSISSRLYACDRETLQALEDAEKQRQQEKAKQESASYAQSSSGVYSLSDILSKMNNIMNQKINATINGEEYKRILDDNGNYLTYFDSYGVERYVYNDAEVDRKYEQLIQEGEHSISEDGYYLYVGDTVYWNSMFTQGLQIRGTVVDIGALSVLVTVNWEACLENGEWLPMYTDGVYYYSDTASGMGERTFYSLEYEDGGYEVVGSYLRKYIE